MMECVSSGRQAGRRSAGTVASLPAETTTRQREKAKGLAGLWKPQSPPPPTRLWLLSLPKHLHQLGTKNHIQELMGAILAQISTEHICCRYVCIGEVEVTAGNLFNLTHWGKVSKPRALGHTGLASLALQLALGILPQVCGAAITNGLPHLLRIYVGVWGSEFQAPMLDQHFTHRASPASIYWTPCRYPSASSMIRFCVLHSGNIQKA